MCWVINWSSSRRSVGRASAGRILDPNESGSSSRTHTSTAVFELTGGTFSFELHDVLANNEHAAALITIRGERAGKQQLNENEVLIYHFRDGKVSEAWIQSTDQYAADEFFS